MRKSMNLHYKIYMPQSRTQKYFHRWHRVRQAFWVISNQCKYSWTFEKVNFGHILAPKLMLLKYVIVCE